jgi:hypothetical protein
MIGSSSFDRKVKALNHEPPVRVPVTGGKRPQGKLVGQPLHGDHREGCSDADRYDAAVGKLVRWPSVYVV